MTDIKEIHLTDTAPHYETTQVENVHAKSRGKENLRVEDGEGHFTPLFSKSATTTEMEPDLVDKMEREYRLLLQLRRTGVTPQPLLFKTNEERTSGNLLTSVVQGKSLEEAIYDNEIDDIARSRFEEVVEGAFSSLDQIHAHNILVRDINIGTFVIDGMNNPEGDISVGVVDFELGVHKDDMISILNKYKYGQWYARDDPGYALADLDRSIKFDFEVAKKVERYIAFRVLCEAFLENGDQIELDELTPEDQVLYRLQYARLKPSLDRYAQARKIELSGLPPENQQRTLDTEMEVATHHIMMNITLPYLLRGEGLSLSQGTLNYATAALSPFLEDRPSYAIDEVIPDHRDAV